MDEDVHSIMKEKEPYIISTNRFYEWILVHNSATFLCNLDKSPVPPGPPYAQWKMRNRTRARIRIPVLQGSGVIEMSLQGEVSQRMDTL